MLLAFSNLIYGSTDSAGLVKLDNQDKENDGQADSR